MAWPPTLVHDAVRAGIIPLMGYSAGNPKLVTSEYSLVVTNGLPPPFAA
jgi:hypothetical protein